MKLSRTGWNNVIIFSVMAFILLINATHNQVFSPSEPSADQALFLFGENSVILTLSIGQQIKIERIGRTWRATPAVISGQALEQMMFTWQNTRGSLLTSPPDLDRQMALVVIADVAGQPTAKTLSLFSTEQGFLVFDHQTTQWISIPQAIFSQLIPSEVLAI